MNKISNVYTQLQTVIKGQDQTIRLILASLLAKGHVLLEDLPGTGKTTLAKELSQCFLGKFARIQFTPDLMPSDITGTTVFNPREQTFDFHQGAIFCNFLLADEINRASPRTQSALLEAMEEHQVSSEGKTLALPNPFFVIATENPVEMHGTYPLPEAQLDRFMCKVSLGYVPEEQEIEILLSKIRTRPSTGSVSRLTVAELVEMQKAVSEVHVSEPMARYITQLARFTRTHNLALVGASTRGAINLMRMSQGLAFLSNATFVSPAQVQEAAKVVLSHRIVLRDSAKMGSKSAQQIVEDALNAVSTPV